MRSAWIAALFVVSGCATEPPRPTSAGLEASEPGTDAPPRSIVAGHAAIAQVSFAGGTAFVDPDRRLWIADANGERMVARAVGGRPVSDGLRLVWSEPAPDLATCWIHVLDASGAVHVSQLDGSFAPIAIEQEQLVLLGSRNGGVAGLWVSPLGSGNLACATNCDLRAGRPWGDAYLPPPGDARSITIDGDRLRYRDVDDRAREARIGGDR